MQDDVGGSLALETKLWSSSAGHGPAYRQPSNPLSHLRFKVFIDPAIFSRQLSSIYRPVDRNS